MHSGKDTPGCHHTLQNHTFTIHQSELSTDHPSHSLHVLANLWDFTILYERSCTVHSYALYRCSHNWNIFTSCTTNGISQGGAITHWGNITFNHALTSFLWRYASFLQIPMHSHVLIADEQFLLTHQCTLIGSCTQQLEVYEVFNLPLPHGNFSAQWTT